MCSFNSSGPSPFDATGRFFRRSFNFLAEKRVEISVYCDRITGVDGAFWSKKLLLGFLANSNTILWASSQNVSINQNEMSKKAGV